MSIGVTSRPITAHLGVVRQLDVGLDDLGQVNIVESIDGLGTVRPCHLNGDILVSDHNTLEHLHYKTLRVTYQS